MGEDVTMMFALESEFLIDKGYPDEAVYLCLDGIKMFPKYVAGYTMLAKSYIVLGRLDEALQTIEDAIKKFPRHKTLINFAKFELGIEYEEFNLANFREILERDEDFVFDLSTKNYRESVKRKFANKVKSSNNDSYNNSISAFAENENDIEFKIPHRNYHDNVVASHIDIDYEMLNHNQNKKSYSINIDKYNIPSNLKLDEEIDIYNETNSADFNTIPGLFDFKSSKNLIDIVIDNELRFDNFDIGLGYKFPKLEHKFKNSPKTTNNNKLETNLIQNSIQEISNSNKELVNLKNEELDLLDELINVDRNEYDNLNYDDNSSNPGILLNENSISNELLNELSELNDFYQTQPNKNDSLHLEILETIIDNNNDFDLLSEIDTIQFEKTEEINLESKIEEELKKIIIEEVTEEEVNNNNFEFDFNFDYLDKVTNQVAIGIGNLTNQASLEMLEESVGEDGNPNYYNLGSENNSDISLDNLEDIITNNFELEDFEKVDSDLEVEDIEIEIEDLGNNLSEVSENEELEAREFETDNLEGENSNIENTELESSELENLDLLLGENHNEDDNFNDTEIVENENLISIDNLEDLLLNHNENIYDEISITESEDVILEELSLDENILDDIPNETAPLEDELVQEEIVQDEVIQEKKVDILSEVNNRLANAEYSWAEVERLLNENDSKNDDKITTLDETSEENNEEEIEDEPAQTSMLPVSETLAKIYETQEAYEDSIKIYKKLIIKNPDKADLYNRNIKRIKKIIKKLEKKPK